MQGGIFHSCITATMNQLSLMQTNITTVNYSRCSVCKHVDMNNSKGSVIDLYVCESRWFVVGGAMKMMRILVRLVSCWVQTYWLPNKIRVLF